MSATQRRAAPAPQGATPPLPPLPPEGTRRHAATRRVRLGDVRPDGRARLDAVARWLQDVAADDVRDAGAADRYRWVVRRTLIDVAARPRYDEPLDLVTWCSGTGAAWAERRTSLRGAAGGRVEAVSVWVSLDPASNRPAPLRTDFLELYGPSTAGRVVRSRLLHPAQPPGGAPSRRWALRHADLDALGHVNNAVAWALVEEEAALRAPGVTVTGGSVEYRAPIEEADALTVRSERDGGALRLWASDATGAVALTAEAQLAPPG